MYSASRLLAEIIIIMPTVVNSASTGYSKRSMPSRAMKPGDIIRQRPAPIRISTLR